MALQLGHRRSVDLDFFGIVPQTPDELQDLLRENHDVTIVKESKNIHIYLIDGVKVDIVNYKYDWIDTPIEEDGIRLADVKDIAAMKVAAIIGRGTKKDFIDLYFLLKQYSLKELLELYLQKYPDGSLFIAIKSLSYFEDAEADPMPVMFEEVSWPDVKALIGESISTI